MRPTLVRRALPALLFAASLRLAAGAAPAASPAPAAAKPSPTPAVPVGGPYTSARICSSCHPAIYKYWAESTHARAATRPSYLEAVRGAVEGALDKEAVQRGCVWCHAPTSLVTGDFDLKKPLTSEGITCDFCHTVADVDLDKADHPFDLKPGKVKRGPLRYAKSPSHETEYSPLPRPAAPAPPATSAGRPAWRSVDLR
jgi:hypothetical protein